MKKVKYLLGIFILFSIFTLIFIHLEIQYSQGGILKSKIVSPYSELSTEIPNTVTADIQAGIEKYIDEKTKEGKGYFLFRSDNKEFAFKLVRVHTEYLSTLGTQRYFACVDMVDTYGDVYDIDFFLFGDPKNMDVIETTLHKLNGKPFYSWEQKKDKSWYRVPTKKASGRLFEIIEKEDNFEFRYNFNLPQLDQPARLWVPYPQTDLFQIVQLISISVPKNYKIIEDKEYKNKIFLFELEPEDRSKKNRYKIFSKTEREVSIYS